MEKSLEVNNNNDNITLEVRSPDGSRTLFKMKQTTPLRKLIMRFSDSKRLPRWIFRFFYESYRIRESDTPLEQGMSDGDIIDIYVMQPFPTEILKQACEENDLVAVRSIIRLLPQDHMKYEMDQIGGLKIAVEKNYNELFNILLDVDDIDKANREHGKDHCGASKHGNGTWNTHVILAIQRNKVEIVKIFSSNQTVNWNHQTANGDTAAILAAEGNSTEILKILKDIPSIDWNLTNNEGVRALTAALKNCFLDAAKIILSIPRQTMNWNHQTANGDTAAILAAKGNSIEILKILKDIPSIDWKLNNNEGVTAFTAALKNCFLDSAKIILSIPGLVIDAKALKDHNIPREMVEKCIESLADTSNEINNNIKSLMQTGNNVYRHMNSLMASLGD